jgi:hypothetical protein
MSIITFQSHVSELTPRFLASARTLGHVRMLCPSFLQQLHAMFPAHLLHKQNEMSDFVSLGQVNKKC